MARKYLVTEIQVRDTGAVQNPTYAYDDENSALAKYFSILAAAVKSSLPVHSALMFTDEGYPLRYEGFTHEAES
jgi:hypothetical protein